jgi:dGTPase
VAQIATTTAKPLHLDISLTEAIALGHDIGHTPFGHSGERALNLIMSECDSLDGLAPEILPELQGFKHNLQGVRIATDLDKLYDDLSGLNLTNYTLWGISSHTSSVWSKCDFAISPSRGKVTCFNINSAKCDTLCNKLERPIAFYHNYSDIMKIDETANPAWSFEGFIVKMADDIAQRHHDIEDGVIAKIIEKRELKAKLKKYLYEFLDDNDKALIDKVSLKNTSNFVQVISRVVVGTLNNDLIENSEKNLEACRKQFKIKNRSDFENRYKNMDLSSNIRINGTYKKVSELISYSQKLQEADQKLRDFLRERVINSYPSQRMDGKAVYIVRQLAKAYLLNPQQLPDNYIKDLYVQYKGGRFKNKSSGVQRIMLKQDCYLDTEFKQILLRTICDFISSMTDDFALREHQRLYSSSSNIDFRWY